VRKSDLLAELTGVMSDGVAQDLWITSVGVDNTPWGQYQPLIPNNSYYYYSGRNNITCNTNSKHRTAAKLRTLETWLFSGM
jgi:hypothetical protein